MKLLEQKKSRESVFSIESRSWWDNYCTIMKVPSRITSTFEQFIFKELSHITEAPKQRDELELLPIPFKLSASNQLLDSNNTVSWSKEGKIWVLGQIKGVADRISGTSRRGGGCVGGLANFFSTIPIPPFQAHLWA